VAHWLTKKDDKKSGMAVMAQQQTAKVDQ